MKSGEKIIFPNGREITVTNGLQVYVVGYSKTNEEAINKLLDVYRCAYNMVNVSDEDIIRDLFERIDHTSEELVCSALDKTGEILYRSSNGLPCGLDW